MSVVRVVARIRPLLPTENAHDQIVSTSNGHDGVEDGCSQPSSVVKIPNPKNLGEEYSFQFNSVYDKDATQQQIFDAEGMLFHALGFRRLTTRTMQSPRR